MLSRSGLRKALIGLARWLCAGILLYAAGRQIVAELEKLHGREINLDLALLFAGALLYTAAMSCFACYWRQTALGMGGRLGSLEVQANGPALVTLFMQANRGLFGVVVKVGHLLA